MSASGNSESCGFFTVTVSFSSDAVVILGSSWTVSLYKQEKKHKKEEKFIIKLQDRYVKGLTGYSLSVSKQSKEKLEIPSPTYLHPIYDSFYVVNEDLTVFPSNTASVIIELY